MRERNIPRLKAKVRPARDTKEKTLTAVPDLFSQKRHEKDQIAFARIERPGGK